MISQILYDIWNGDLKDDIHTAFQVKTQANLGLKALLVRIDTQVLDRIFVILLGNWVFNLSSLAVVIARGYWE